MWGDNKWDPTKATALAKEFEAEQQRKHQEKLAKNKADREAKRRAAKIKPPEEYPWMKDKQGD
ncbi:hypothetical protein JP75_08150 [Devosia riboflavina]|uniref:Uncharacterized protein n=1 Tax=Devosia riboflavina TaxID=46914 RepID=A0A087M3P5_9HYPH|nr:hypothetical protein [Devosia riboflavina]KFL31498.1 hypothetical protein JP75_08150 [Devosia riboflavina]